jgi:hypothetical protein
VIGVLFLEKPFEDFVCFHSHFAEFPEFGTVVLLARNPPGIEKSQHQNKRIKEYIPTHIAYSYSNS